MRLKSISGFFLPMGARFPNGMATKHIGRSAASFAFVFFIS
jgi:hypothetical protein